MIPFWPFRKEPRKPPRNREVERLQKSVSDERGKLYSSLFRLDTATHRLEAHGVAGMLNEMFSRLDEAKHRD